MSAFKAERVPSNIEHGLVILMKGVYTNETYILVLSKADGGLRRVYFEDKYKGQGVLLGSVTLKNSDGRMIQSPEVEIGSHLRIKFSPSGEDRVWLSAKVTAIIVMAE